MIAIGRGFEFCGAACAAEVVVFARMLVSSCGCRIQVHAAYGIARRRCGRNRSRRGEASQPDEVRRRGFVEISLRMRQEFINAMSAAEKVFLA